MTFAKPIDSVAWIVIVAFVVLVGSTTLIWAQESGPSLEERAGHTEYQRSCAACHGPGGQGDGPIALELSTRPSNLTVLSRDNGGTFPFERVFATIDGREEVKSHGSRAMPVWGDRFQITESGLSEFGGEYVALGRTLALVHYLRSIQVE